MILIALFFRFCPFEKIDINIRARFEIICNSIVVTNQIKPNLSISLNINYIYRTWDRTGWTNARRSNGATER
jgi:hypothetical protein